MKIFCILAATLISMLPTSSIADSISDKLDGTWIETEKIKDYPRTILHFKGKKLRFENLFGNSATVDYKIMDKKKEEFTVTFEYRYKVKRGNGRIVEHMVSPEFLYHVENGRPILSEKEFEYDGRGPIIMNEYLKEKDFIDGFRSVLQHRLNDRSAPSMMKE